MLILLAALVPQDEKMIKDKQAEIMAFAKTAKNERDFRAVTDDLVKLAEEAFGINKYELAAKLYSDAERLARTALKDAAFGQSLQDSAKRAADVGKEYTKAAKGVERIIRNEGTPEDYTLSGKFLCFVKGDWELGLADLSKGKDEALKKLAEDDIAAGNPAALGDAWFAAMKKEPAAKDRALFWYAKVWPTLTGVSREKVRERAKTLQRVGAAKRGPAPSGWTFSPPPDVQWAETEFVHSGKYSIAIKSGISTPTGAAGLGQVFTARPGTKLKLSGWCMTDGTSGKDQLLLVYHDLAGKHLGQDGPTVPDDFPFWVRIHQEVTVPPTTARIILNFQANGKQGMIWLDDVSVLDENGAELIKNGGFE
jgi:hypothetical protein